MCCVWVGPIERKVIERYGGSGRGNNCTRFVMYQKVYCKTTIQVMVQVLSSHGSLIQVPWPDRSSRATVLAVANIT